MCPLWSAQAGPSIPTFTWLPISSTAWISWHQHHQELSLQGLHGPELPGWGILEGGVIPDPCSPKWILPPPSRTSILAGSLQPGDEKLVLESVRVGPVTMRAQANRLPLGRTALLINHASGKRVVCPRAHFDVTKPVWQRLSVNEKTTACLPCPLQEGQDTVLFKNKSSFPSTESKPRASRESLFQDLLVTETRKQSSQLEQWCRTKNKRKLEGCAASIQK